MMLSIIIPTWNEEKCLPKLLECIKRQSFRDYEVIIADADSTDRTREIARKYNCKIVKGGLPAVGRNKGAKTAKGDILLFLDADVQFDKNFLKNALKDMKERKLDVAGLYMGPLSNKLIDKIFLRIFNIVIFIAQFFYPGGCGCGIFCKKWLHKKVNGFDKTVKMGDDVEYIQRCSKYGKFRILKNVKISFSMRRFEKEGRFKVGLKHLLSAIHKILLGHIKSNIFNYKLKYNR